MSEENKELVRRYYAEVLNGRNLDAVGDYFADERMVEGVRRGCFSYFEAFPDLHVSVDELIAEGDRVFCRSTMTGTHDGEYKGIPADRSPRLVRVGGGVPDRGRQVRRLLVPVQRRRADAAADRGAGRRLNPGSHKLRSYR